MAIICSPQSLSGSAVCFFSCIPDGAQQALQTYLLAQIANRLNPSIPTSATALLAAATAQGNSFVQVDGMQEAVQSYLWTTAATARGVNIPTSPSQLAGTAVCFFTCIPDGMNEAMQSFLFAQLLNQLNPASSTDAKTLFSKATAQGNSFMQLDGIQDSVQSYLICQIASAIGGIPGSTCAAATLPRAAVCFQSCISDGEQVAVQNYTLCQISAAGGFGGGSVAPAFPAVTNFLFAPGGGTLGSTAVAAFDTPPAGATATELWTSLDGITYSLNTTYPTPMSGGNITAPAVGQFMFGKVRWVNLPATGAFSAPLQVSGRVCDWARRCVVNGAAGILLNTRQAMNTFDLALVAAALDSHMYTLNCVVPDSLNASLTPLYKAQGSDPYSGDWAAVGSTVGLTGNGWTFPNANSGVGTGAIPSNFFAVGNGGVSAYAYNNQSDASIATMGCVDGGARENRIYCNQAPNGGGSMFAQDAAFLFVALPSNPFNAYLSVNRVSTTDIRLFGANSSTAHAQIGATNANANATTPPTVQFIIFGYNNNGVSGGSTTAKTISYFSLHDGFSQAQSLAEFNAVQSMRTTFGGGFR